MTKKQANTLMALGIAIILTQVLCTAILLRCHARLRVEEQRARAEMNAADVAPRVILRPAGTRLIFDPVRVERPLSR
jgi:uncharacterized membrane protein